MTQTLSISAFIGSGLLMIPFVFYSLMYRGMVGSLWTGGVLIVFFVSMYRLRKEGLRTLLVISVCSSGAMALPSLVMLSPTIALVFSFVGAVVLGLFAYATYTWRTTLINRV